MAKTKLVLDKLRVDFVGGCGISPAFSMSMTRQLVSLKGAPCKVQLSGGAIVGAGVLYYGCMGVHSHAP